MRLDHIFSPKDTLSAVYTIDDSADFTPTSTNLYSTDVESLREQVASIEETHVFSADAAQHGARRLFARRLFLHRRTDAGHSRGQPARLPDGASDRRGGGGRQRGVESHRAIEPGGKQQRQQSATSRAICSRMRTACPSPRAAISSASGAWFQRLRSNENLALSQYGQATFTSLQTFLQGTVGTLLYDPAPTPLGWRSWFGAWYAEDVIRVSPQTHAVARLPRRIHHRLERGARPGRHLHVHRTASSRRSRPSATRPSR